MKSTGTLREYIQRTGQHDPGQRTDYYVYRRISLAGGVDAEVTGLVLTASAVNDSGPGCLAYRSDAEINNTLKQITESEPDFAVRSDAGTVLNQYWRIEGTGAGRLHTCLDRLDKVSTFYPLNSWTDPGHETVSRLPVVLIADDQLHPLPCHRLLADLAGMDDYEFLQRLQKCFNVRVASGMVDATPDLAREFGLYVAGNWYHLRLIEGTWFHADPVSDLDVSVVHDNMIAPMLGISDPHDDRIMYTSALCNLPELQQEIDAGRWRALWLMPAPEIGQLMAISDLGRLMPDNAVRFRPVFEPDVFARIAG